MNKTNTIGENEIERSLELLDRVLSEFDDIENANQEPPVIRVRAEAGKVQTPDDDVSIAGSGGHQSEDDGYMSMNGRKTLAITFAPLVECTLLKQTVPLTPKAVNGELEFPPPPEEAQRIIADLLPRITSSHSMNKITDNHPCAVDTYYNNNDRKRFVNSQISQNDATCATQMTLPKTRHQRPFGWNKQPNNRRKPDVSVNAWTPPPTPDTPPPQTNVRNRLLSNDTTSTWTSKETTSSSELEEEHLIARLASNDENFSDDSLEEALAPTSTSTSKRGSIAWEVPLDEDLYVPGSTKVVGGRRRRKSSDLYKSGDIYSACSEIGKSREQLLSDDSWPEPPVFANDAPEFYEKTDMTAGGTYVIRKKKERSPLHNIPVVDDYCDAPVDEVQYEELDPNVFKATPKSRALTRNSPPRSIGSSRDRFSLDLSSTTSSEYLHTPLNTPKYRHSLDLNGSNEVGGGPSGVYFKNAQKHSTFDNIKTYVNDHEVANLAQGKSLTEAGLVRVTSLPTLSDECLMTHSSSRELPVTVEEEEIDSPKGCESDDGPQISPLRQIEQNISELLKLDNNTLQSSLYINENDYRGEVREIKFDKRKIQNDSLNHHRRKGIQKSESAKDMQMSRSYHHDIAQNDRLTSSNSVDFPVRVDVIHEFPPLPPSPVEEDEDEYMEISNPVVRASNRSNISTGSYRSTLSSQRSKTTINLSSGPPIPPHHDSNSLKTTTSAEGFNRDVRFATGSARRQIPAERRTLPSELAGFRRKTFLKRSSLSSRDDNYMQTSCSLPETPIFARGCDILRTPHRKAPELAAQGSRTTPRQVNNFSANAGYRTTSATGSGNSPFEQALVGAELLRLAGGPGRGWYPRHRTHRPASIENLDRITSGGPHLWDASSRKPLTLPPNLTPKFFNKSPREALRRVTSLLIRGKGNSSSEKDVKKNKIAVSPTKTSNGVDESQKKKGFFKNFWKKSKHYSLD